MAPNNCGLDLAALIEYKFEQYHGDYQWFQSALHQKRGVKPPRQKRGNQRRHVVIPVFEVVGVEPSPLFEWAVLVTFPE